MVQTKRPSAQSAGSRPSTSQSPAKRVAYRVLIDPERLAALRAIKQRTGESVQPLIRRAIEDVIQQYGA